MTQVTTNGAKGSNAIILVANKTDLERCRVISRQGEITEITQSLSMNSHYLGGRRVTGMTPVHQYDFTLTRFHRIANYNLQQGY